MSYILLVGRPAERGRISALMESARSGRSAALVVEGEPGVGKTALLEEAVARAAGLTVLRARGVESEIDLPCAGVAQLVGGITDLVTYLPAPQRNALEAALALAESPAPIADRFAVGAGLLGLLALAARRSPVLAVVDDAHWLDGPTIAAVHFVARRLGAEGIALLIGSRDVEPDARWFEDVPRLRVAGLDPPAARQMLARHGVADLTDQRVAQLVRATGNPLALVELPRLMTWPELTGDIPEHNPPPIGPMLQAAYGRRFSLLPAPAQDALLVLALLDSADRRLVDASLRQLDLHMDDLNPAEAAALIEFGTEGRVFRHPLIRSAVASAAPSSRCRRAHAAAAAALGGAALAVDQARRAWHAAAAVTGFSEAAASLL